VGGGEGGAEPADPVDSVGAEDCSKAGIQERELVEASCLRPLTRVI
jgi:hypothetical protein